MDEDKIKKLFSEMHINHQHNINKQIQGIFLFGFTMGIAFSYSGLFGFSTGFLTGLVLTRKLSDKTQEATEKISDTFLNMINQLQKNFEWFKK
jgi:hypothetical protein